MPAGGEHASAGARFAFSWGAFWQFGRMEGNEHWLDALWERAAHLAFPDWDQQDDDWTSLHTRYNEHGTPVCEVAVYRGHDRIHHIHYEGAAVMAFWTTLLNEITE